MELRVPRFKLEHDESDDFSLGTLSLSLIVGFGLHWGWVYLTMINGRALFTAESPALVSGNSLFYLVSLGFLVASMLTYAVFSRQMRALFSTKKRRGRIRLFGAVIMSAGTLCMVPASMAGSVGFAATVLGGMATGIGSCILLMSFGVSFSQCDTATIVTSTALALTVGTFVYAGIVVLQAIAPIGAYVCAVLPIAECWLLHRCSSHLVDNLEFTAITLKVRKPAFAVRLCLPSILFGFALGAVRTDAIDCSRVANDPALSLAAITLASVVSCALMIVAMLNRRQHLNFMFRALMPIVAIAFLWLTYAQPASAFAILLVLFCGYLLFESMMWLTYSEISQRFRISAFIVFGFGRSALAFGTLLGTIPLPKFAQAGSSFLNDQTMVAIFFCMLVGFALLPRGSEIRETLVGESDASEYENNSRLDDESLGQTEDQERKGRFKRKCEQVAIQYLLSRKETEVLFLLAKGRNAAAIQEALYIAEGTVRTHMRHIYKKLDVHTQQELIDLVESTELDQQ